MNWNQEVWNWESLKLRGGYFCRFYCLILLKQWTTKYFYCLEINDDSYFTYDMGLKNWIMQNYQGLRVF